MRRTGSDGLPVIPDPFGMFTGWTRHVDGFDQTERVRRGMWLHAHTPRPPVGLTPHEVVHRHDKLVVRYYAACGPRPGLPVVLVPSMINRAYVLDLEPDRSMVAALSAMGHPVYLVDWGVPGPEDADEDVGYVLLDLLHRSIERIRRHARVPKVHLFGYCMGGTLTVMLAAVRPERIASLSVLAAPVRFEAGGRFRDFVGPEVLDVERAIDPDGLVPVEVMAPAFKMLDPMGNWNKYLGIEAAAHDPVKLRRVMARERWLEENVPMPGAFAREFIREAYQDDRLLDGTWRVRGRAVRLERITMPTFVIVCGRDFISPPEACLPLSAAVGGPVVTEVLDAGHIGVVVGGMGNKLFFPMLDRWFRTSHTLGDAAPSGAAADEALASAAPAERESGDAAAQHDPREVSS